MSRQNIPVELQKLTQWVGATKEGVPIDPKTGKNASNTDPKTWATFRQACACGTEFVAFVFSKNDPYVVIDLDTHSKDGTGPTPAVSELHYTLITALESYTETSKSGKNTHVIVKAPGCESSFNDKGSRLELYSHSKSITLTGDMFFCAEISDRSAQVEELVSEYAKPTVELSDKIESKTSELTDKELTVKITSSKSREKFIVLFTKDIPSLDAYRDKSGKFDHSRADAALITMLDFFTKDTAQVKRIFESSALYREEKIRKSKNYIEITLRRSRAYNEAQQKGLSDLIQFDHLKPKIEAMKKEPPKALETSTQYAPGLLGEITKYIYDAATRPVYEVALAGALVLLAGITSRYYNISHTGLNQYVLLLAETGIGKSCASEGIELLCDAIRKQTNSIDQHIGAGDYSSGQGVLQVLQSKPCVFTILGEFGYKLEAMCGKNANGADLTLQRTFLDLYKKSGAHNVEQGRSTAKKADSSGHIRSPNLTLLGEATQSSVFKTLTEDMVESGLLPRFLFLEYTGDRPPENDNAFGKPSSVLVNKLVDLVTTCDNMRLNSSHVNIKTRSDAGVILKAFSLECDANINKGGAVARQLWSRGHLKALRLAGLLAVGSDHHDPIVTVDHAKWAIKTVREDVAILLGRFESGQIGEGEHRLVPELVTICKEYITLSQPDRIKAGVLGELIDKQGLIPYSWLVHRTAKSPIFKNTKQGISMALSKTLQDLIKAGYLVKHGATQTLELVGAEMDLYRCGPMLLKG